MHKVKSFARSKAHAHGYNPWSEPAQPQLQLVNSSQSHSGAAGNAGTPSNSLAQTASNTAANAGISRRGNINSERNPNLNPDPTLEDRKKEKKRGRNKNKNTDDPAGAGDPGGSGSGEKSNVKRGRNAHRETPPSTGRQLHEQHRQQSTQTDSNAAATAPVAGTEKYENGDPTIGSSTDGDDGSAKDTPPVWRRFLLAIKDILLSSWVNVLLVFVPVGIVMEVIHASPTIIFVMNAIAIVPLAGLLSFATESVAARLGDTIGALMNVTFGNAVELIIFIIALTKDEIRIVQASLLGSVLANLLLILGMCFLLGGLRFREQIYNSTVTQMSACLLSLSVMSLLLPTAFHAAFNDSNIADDATLKVSRGTSVILLLVYLLYLTFQLYSHAYMYESTPQHIIDEESHPGMLAHFGSSSSSSSSSSRSSSSSSNSSSFPNRVGRRVRERLRRLSVNSRTDDIVSPPMSPPAIEKDGPVFEEPEDMNITTEPPQAGPSVTIQDNPVVLTASEPAPAGTETLKPLSGIRAVAPRLFSFQARVHDATPETSEPVTRGRPLRRANSLPPRLNQPILPELPHLVPLNVSVRSLELEAEAKHHISRTSAVILLLVSTGLVAVCAEFLVGSINHLVESTGISEAFVGLILLPIVGNAAEHVTAVTVAAKNKMDLAIGVAVGSSIQIALFVTPIIVILGWIMEKEMGLYFNIFETVTLFVSAFIVNFLVLDGRSNYLEGALLCCSYVIIAVAAFFYPNEANQSTFGTGSA